MAAAAIVLETPRRRRRWAIAGLLAAQAFRGSAVSHFGWVRRQAVTRPAWWNRALTAGSPPGRAGPAAAGRVTEAERLRH